ncbi:MAG: response regulator [Nitrosopumilaceae archaeon]|nr:response regulator [Nitrosopumilaceae archaeon]NIU02485.1 response regulator [Nitrosopumilaceae archaeon]NIU88946.1 response regulator [Nitrosopumilaceae archaeon]NIV67057.1 response regulator [Nitrosopumilaceae archaeon]NIX63086.1 response regulator [Nitrosopumilaceae archaeon]
MSQQTRQLTAIVIDDDINTGLFLNDLLEYHNIQVLAKGRDGEEAVSLYKQFRPDVILIDVMMKNYDGLYALEHIKSYDPNATIIMHSVDYTADIENKLESLNPTTIINKPTSTDALLNPISDLLKNKNMPQPNLMMQKTVVSAL